MAIQKTRPKRTITGGRYKSYRKKRVYELGSLPVLTKLASTRRISSRGVGGNIKRKILSTNVINVMGKDGKCFQANVNTVTDSPANKHFIRRNILTKGSVVATDKGNVKITSRPGQVGTLNGVLID